MAFSEIIPEITLMVGCSKAGKTCSCHIIANNNPKAVNVKGDLKYFAQGDKNIHAKIGNTNRSETEIPNLFDITYPDDDGRTVKAKLGDLAGDEDS